MIYSLVEKLKFDENPKLELKKGKYVEIKSDAETILTLLSILQEKGEMEAIIAASELLFNEKDKKIIKALQFEDFKETVSTAMILALGEDPDKEENELGEK